MPLSTGDCFIITGVGLQYLSAFFKSFSCHFASVSCLSSFFFLSFHSHIFITKTAVTFVFHLLIKTGKQKYPLPLWAFYHPAHADSQVETRLFLPRFKLQQEKLVSVRVSLAWVYGCFHLILSFYLYQRLSSWGLQPGMQKPPRRLPGLHASPYFGQSAGWSDHGAAKASGKLQPTADGHVWHHWQVRANSWTIITQQL